MLSTPAMGRPPSLWYLSVWFQVIADKDAAGCLPPYNLSAFLGTGYWLWTFLWEVPTNPSHCPLRNAHPSVLVISVNAAPPLLPCHSNWRPGSHPWFLSCPLFPQPTSHHVQSVLLPHIWELSLSSQAHCHHHLWPTVNSWLVFCLWSLSF